MQTLLVTTLDSTVRLLDVATGQVLNTFKGHLNSSYRCRSCFTHDESTVICGDENGTLWKWDIVEVGWPHAIFPANIDCHCHRESLYHRILLQKYTPMSSPGLNTIQLRQER
jgi:WD40 repeat protein